MWLKKEEKESSLLFENMTKKHSCLNFQVTWKTCRRAIVTPRGLLQKGSTEEK